VWWQVEVEVEVERGFLNNGDVKVVNLLGEFHEDPLEQAKGADPALEFGPERYWTCPDADAIIHISFVDG
jgi:hypothetical protein